jgi:hypothetical protein
MRSKLTYPTTIISGGIGGAIFAYAFNEIYNSFYPTTLSQLSSFKGKITTRVSLCPKANSYLDKTIKDMPKAGIFPQHIKLFEQYACETYNKISSNDVVTIKSIMTTVKQGFNIIEKAMEETSKPIILLLGEMHDSQQSFLLEALLLTYLKHHNLSSNLLAERDLEQVTELANTSPANYLDINIFQFASHVLNYNLVAIDPFNKVSKYSPLSKERETMMLVEIQEYLEKQPEKVNVISLGMFHLPTFDATFKHLLSDSFHTISINTAEITEAYKRLPHYHETATNIPERFLDLESHNIHSLKFSENIESMTLGQLLDVFQSCHEYDGNSDISYTSIGLDYCGSAASIDDVRECF